MTKTQLLPLALLASVTSFAQLPSRFDVVITEIMADPAPAVGLPNAEYIEIKNVSSTSFNLNGWKLSDATTTATISSAVLLQPDSVVILCATTNATAFSVYGRSIGVTSFPSIDNDGDVLTLRSPQNKIIHTITYTSDWYRNEAKKEGGWSLEIIDAKNPCTGKDNWKASVSNSGGTPGKTNSVNAVNADVTPPQLLRAYTTDSVTIMLVFNEPLDSASASVVTNYSLPGFTVTAATVIAPQFQNVQLKLTARLLPLMVYTITAGSVTDCKGNAIGAYNKVPTGLPQVPVSQDVVINEILFNPKTPGSDYVEFYNKSKKIIDVSKLYIANRNSAGAVASLKKFTDETVYMFPGDYLVITSDVAVVKQQFFVKEELVLLPLSSLPSFPDDEGHVVLIDINGTLVDDVLYKDDWQFGLIDNKDGVAIERIDPDGKSTEKDNWHSAASTVGFGTPTYKNSQYRLTESIDAAIEVLPKIFSPDNDGTDDVAAINYKVDAAGYVANITVFNASGVIVKYLVRSALLGLSGRWNWDGLGEKQNKLPVGTYIVFTEIFNLQGKKKSFKNTVVLARKLN